MGLSRAIVRPAVMQNASRSASIARSLSKRVGSHHKPTQILFHNVSLCLPRRQKAKNHQVLQLLTSWRFALRQFNQPVFAFGYAGHCFGPNGLPVAAPRVARKGEAWWS